MHHGSLWSHGEPSTDRADGANEFRYQCACAQQVGNMVAIKVCHDQSDTSSCCLWCPVLDLWVSNTCAQNKRRLLSTSCMDLLLLIQLGRNTCHTLLLSCMVSPRGAIGMLLDQSVLACLGNPGQNIQRPKWHSPVQQQTLPARSCKPSAIRMLSKFCVSLAHPAATGSCAASTL